MKYCYPTPNIGLKRRLNKEFEIYNIDEYKTSQLCHSCKNKTENRITINDPRPWKKDSTKQVHGLLSCTNLNCNKLWNRDINGSLNILEIGNSIITNGDRPSCFKRITSDHE